MHVVSCQFHLGSRKQNSKFSCFSFEPFSPSEQLLEKERGDKKERVESNNVGQFGRSCFRHKIAKLACLLRAAQLPLCHPLERA